MGALTKIAVFYDGNFFTHVSNFYAYAHERKARINIQGLHDFIRHRVADEEQTDVRYCQIVDAHYFRGRRSASLGDSSFLYGERLFDTVLMRAGVVMHYLPLVQLPDKRIIEKGIDVSLALEAFESAMLKRYDVLALLAGDSDYVPLVRKLAVAGTRVLLLGFDAKYVDENQNERQTRTSQTLLDVCTYPVMVSTLIDDRAHRNSKLVDGLFVDRAQIRVASPPAIAEPSAASSEVLGAEGVEVSDDAAPESSSDERIAGEIMNLKEGFGFIRPLVGMAVGTGGAGYFFFHTDLVNCDFMQLSPGEPVTNTRGPCARLVKVDRFN
jgi:uncharacterized LabA/DUF88 family protein